MELMNLIEAVEAVEEKIIKKRVVRGGKKVVIKKSDKQGFEIQDGKEIKTDPKVMLQRKRTAKKAARKRKKTSSIASTKRKLSNKLRS